ncbi:MAG: hypothetical protein JRC87_08460 [Deltaproteobacteria bacterium]|nr:hypothetical protein [Deltaproteobacteria bacterium]MBW2659603.1 hypothetical protein [Deltaproteobacteria bacterium]
MEFLTKIANWFESTHLQEQVKDVDLTGLFSNPWFIVPFACLILYLLYKQSWKDIIIISIFIGVWWISGTPYMKSLIVNGEVQIAKILPVIFGGAVTIGFVIYLLFGRSD